MPRYRACRMWQAATVWEMVPWTPARSAYLACQSLLACSARPAASAWCSGGGCGVSWRRPGVRGGALSPGGAGPVGIGGEGHHDGLGAALEGRAPRRAVGSLRAGDLLVVSIDGEGALVEPGARAGLGGVVQQRRGDPG